MICYTHSVGRDVACTRIVWVGMCVYVCVHVCVCMCVCACPFNYSPDANSNDGMKI